MFGVSATASQVAELEGFYREVLKAPPNESVSEWAEREVRIAEGERQGQFSLDLIPYAREPLDCYADKSVTDLVLVFGTQCAKTTIMIVGGMYRIENDPTDCVWVLPNEVLAKSFSRGRWKKYVAECRAMDRHLPRRATGNVDPHLYTVLEQHFSRMKLNFVGSNSPANLASRPAGFLQLDEVDKFGEESDFEASALDNAEERAKTFSFPLIVKSSTPTTVHGGIWREFELSDKRYFFVPCPHCKTFIVLKFRVKSEVHGNCGLRWWRESEDEVKKDGMWDMEQVRRNAFYKCQECGEEIHQGDKRAMLMAGEWRPTNPNAERGRRGYHLSSLYSMLGPKVTFGGIAVAWVQTFGLMSKRHRVINSLLAETWDGEKAVDDRAINKEEYEVEGLPQERLPIMSVDVQQNHFWCLVRAWSPPGPERPHGESWLLFADRLETVAELLEVQERYCVDGENVVLDMAHKPNDVGGLIVQNDWRGMWGSDKKKYVHRQSVGAPVERIYSEVQFRDPHLGTRWEAKGFPSARFVYWCKDPVRDLVFSLRFEEPCYWHVSSTAHPSYDRHLNAHMKLTRQNPRTGRWETYWREMYADDHLLDCECMNSVRAVQLGLVPLLAENPQAYQGQLGV